MKISAEMTFVPRPQINSNRNSGMENIGSRERERERVSLFGDTAGFAGVVENDYANVERIRIPTDYRRPRGGGKMAQCHFIWRVGVSKYRVIMSFRIL